MRFSIRRLMHLVILVVIVQMVIYLWSMKIPNKMVMPVVLQEKYVQPERKGEGTCNYELCPKVKEGVLNVHMIAHSHIDVGWTHTVDEFYTGEAVATSCVKCILELTIKELAKNPDRRYIFIEMKYLARYWQEINETEKDLFRQLIKERRLELVGGGWVMSDAGVTLYNDIIDQHTLGFDFIGENFGPCAQPRTAWHVDLFGYSREHASILSKMGYDSLFISRVDFQDIAERKKSQNMEFIWSTSGQSLKNRNTLFTSILYDGYYAPEGYTMDKAVVAPEVTREIVDKFVNLMKQWSKSYKTQHVVVPMGADFAYRNAETWFNFYDPLIKKANELYPDVHLMYSTPSCHSYYVNKENVTLDVKGDDFHPYAIAPAAYWTGFYTSRGGFKRHIKQAGQILQSCKQMAIFTDLENSSEQVNVLRDAMGVMQHHDAVTGTQRYHVLKDYNRILSEATSVCQKVMAAAYKKTWQIPDTDPLTPQFCFGLNMSSCHVTEEKDEFFVSLYNPLSWTFDVDVRFPVTRSDWIIKDFQDNVVVYQIVPIHEHILRIPERELTKSDSELIMLANLPAMSATTFRVRKKAAGDESKNTYESIPQNTDFIVENEHVSLVFNPQTGLLVSITNRDMSITQALSQEFRYYEAEQNSNRPSGVYLFTPKSNVTIPVAADGVGLKYIRGPLVQEVHQTFSPWVSQVIKLYKGAKHVEFQWTVGPIDDGGIQGKEVISIYTTNIASDDTFYTDSHGREMIQRVKDEKEGSSLEPKDHVSGNYYPITSRIYIKDTKQDVQLSVLTDRPQGGSSLKSGTVELMVHRRVMKDDDLGLAEGLQDNGADGKGIIYTGKHYLVLDTKENSASVIKRLALQVHLAPTIMFTPFVPGNQLKKRPKQETFLAAVLPENIHILTLDMIHFNETNLYLLRIEHLYEENEHRGLSTPTELSLQALFRPFEIVSIVETSLGGNLIPDDVKRLRWHSFKDITSENIGSTDYTRNMEPPFTIVLRPMEIRTFNIFVTRNSD